MICWSVLSSPFSLFFTMLKTRSLSYISVCYMWLGRCRCGCSVCSIQGIQRLIHTSSFAQLFHTQAKKAESVKELNYLGFTWTDRLSLKQKTESCIGHIQRSLCKLKWLKFGHSISSKVIRQCFFAYTFPHFVWLFPSPSRHLAESI
jgi:hypothetical protein